MTARQGAKATIRTQKGRDEGVAGAFQDNLVLDYTGIPGSARPAMEDVQAHLKDTHFAWIGNADSNAPFYYRIQSPVILIEFDHPPMRDGAFSQNHIHTIVRTPNGNDYGRDWRAREVRPKP